MLRGFWRAAWARFDRMRGLGGEALLALALAATLLLAACATGPQRKPTFVGRNTGAREPTATAAGLNPLASLDVCRAGSEGPPPAQTPRVLISAPEHFSRDATNMVLALQEALSTRAQAGEVQMWLAEQRLQGAAEAQAEGRRCGAMMVLWEPHGSNTLEMTLSHRALVPLREQVRERLCAFGSQSQQANVLYLTIAGLAAMLDNRYDDAVYYVDAANRIDHACLQLPGLAHPAAELNTDSTADTP